MAQIRWLLSEAGLIDGIQLNYDAPYSGLCMAYFNGDYQRLLYDYEEQYQASLKNWEELTWKMPIQKLV